MALEIFKDEIEKRRIEKRIKVFELALACSKSISQVSAWFNGYGNLPEESIIKMIEFLGGEIIIGEPPKLRWD